MNDSTKYCIAGVIVALIVTAGLVGGCRAVQETEQEAIKAGLVQSVDHDRGIVVWTKPAEKNEH